jgi:hypothetical protein
LVNKSGQTLNEIVSSVKKVTDIIGEIAAASQEQSGGIDQVNKAVGQMDQVVQSNAAQTEELSSTAQSLASQAEQLLALVSKFKLAESSGVMQQQPVGSAVANVKLSRAAELKRPVVMPKKPTAAAASPEVLRNGDRGNAFEEF